jgi:hypothetical protein
MSLYRYAVSLQEAGATKYTHKEFAWDYRNALVKSVDSTSRVPQRLISKTDPGLLPPAAVTADILPLPLPGHPCPDLAGNKTCEAWSEDSSSDTWFHKLPARKFVYWDDSTRPAADFVGKYGRHRLYINNKDLQTFMIWILGATPNTSSGGGGKAGGKSNPMLDVIQ